MNNKCSYMDIYSVSQMTCVTKSGQRYKAVIKVITNKTLSLSA